VTKLRLKQALAFSDEEFATLRFSVGSTYTFVAGAELTDESVLTRYASSTMLIVIHKTVPKTTEQKKKKKTAFHEQAVRIYN
jgi:hypothetical protein